MTILIVDDIETNRKLLKATLEAENFTILQAADGREALAILARDKVDSIISDVLMPNMDGYKFCQEVRMSPRLKALPFIVYTATYTSPDDQRLAYSMGADVYLVKPAKTEELLAALTEAAKKSKTRQTPPAALPDEQLTVMKEYNTVLIHKLEEKNADLERAMEQLQRAHDRIVDLNASLELRVAERTKELKTALDEVKTLSGLLPICSSCKKIRDDGGSWHQLETYIMKHTDSQFTHGICDDCGEKLYGDDFRRAKKEGAK